MQAVTQALFFDARWQVLSVRSSRRPIFKKEFWNSSYDQFFSARDLLCISLAMSWRMLRAKSWRLFLQSWWWLLYNFGAAGQRRVLRYRLYQSIIQAFETLNNPKPLNPNFHKLVCKEILNKIERVKKCKSCRVTSMLFFVQELES